MDHVDDPLAQPPEASVQPEVLALPAPHPANAAGHAGDTPTLPLGWQAPVGTNSTGQPSIAGPRPLSGVTLIDVLVSPLQELMGLLDNALAKPERPKTGQTMLEWVQLGLPAFPLPEDIRGSFKDQII